MSALTADRDWARLVHAWEETHPPEGCKVEIVDGVITVSLPPSWDNNVTASRLVRRLCFVIPEDWAIFQWQEAVVPGRKGLYMPDVMVVAQEHKPAPGDLFPASRAKFIAEITSPGYAHHDRVAKAHGYAHAGVPLYLLLDPCASDAPTATLYGDPEGGTYRVLEAVAYGGKITLPAPFDLAIDTAEFPVS
ncbi:Uma2 family endonuclease [Streptomyces paludis]|uniref:Uma2 family endonuclease n=1 Tax=Streptomyces paludis TaxID=2282738 RepID=A0A345HT75_9ACTN|nr:Uma2 family endonuclease [Streptomyces paludis]AXG79899.1 Uma2 family endonuclease [Streptomyces paludis]